MHFDQNVLKRQSECIRIKIMFRQQHILVLKCYYRHLKKKKSQCNFLCIETFVLNSISTINPDIIRH